MSDIACTSRVCTTLLETQTGDLGTFAQPKAVFIERGPSGGPELLALISANDQWGEKFWYGHIFCHPDSKQYVSGIFYSKRFINGSNIDLLFKRLYHWTVLDPEIGAPVSQVDGDCFSTHSTFDDAVSGLCLMIASFDKTLRTAGDDRKGFQNKFDERLLGSYDEWGQGNEFTEAYPLPPVALADPQQNKSSKKFVPEPYRVEKPLPDVANRGQITILRGQNNETN